MNYFAELNYKFIKLFLESIFLSFFDAKMFRVPSSVFSWLND